MTTSPDGGGPRYYGVYPAFVTDLVDKEGRGRIQVRFPTLGTDGNNDVRAWATLCSPYADKGHGLEILPEVGSQVLVAFHAGELNHGYIIGACWNGQAKPPEEAAAANNIRVLKSRADSVLRFDDTAGAAKVTLAMKSGHTVELDDAGDQIVIKHAKGPTITLTASGEIILKSTTATIDVSLLTVKAATSDFAGIINCKALNASVSVSGPLVNTAVGNLL